MVSKVYDLLIIICWNHLSRIVDDLNRRHEQKDTKIGQQDQRTMGPKRPSVYCTAVCAWYQNVPLWSIT